MIACPTVCVRGLAQWAVALGRAGTLLESRKNSKPRSAKCLPKVLQNPGVHCSLYCAERTYRTCPMTSERNLEDDYQGHVTCSSILLPNDRNTIFHRVYIVNFINLPVLIYDNMIFWYVISMKLTDCF